MYLLFFNNYGGKKTIELPSDIGYVIEQKDGDEFFFFNDNINDLKLEKVSDELRKIDIEELPYVTLKIEKNKELTSVFPIKSINYRIVGYAYKNHTVDREALSIKFFKNNRFKQKNRETVYCDVMCPHFADKGYCKYYDKELIKTTENGQIEFIVCKLCYYDILNFIDRGINKKNYLNMINEEINKR